MEKIFSKNIFSERLQEAMDIRDMSQAELVKLTGITKGAISSYINGTYTAKQNNSYKLALALRVDPAWLMGKDVPMEKSTGGNLVAEPSTEYSRSIKVPVYGSIPAGVPLEAIEDIQGEVEIPTSWAKGGREYIALMVKGDSIGRVSEKKIKKI